ncbi:MAG: DUF1622 domain-containing protein [Euryarchaeota archaeon]|nr:DUF1622 domain-containing protein [Euryarchaeota archaeon]
MLRFRGLDNSVMIESSVLLINIASWVDLVNLIVTIFEAVGAIIIFYGSAVVVVDMVASVVRQRPFDYSAIRREYSKKIALALEFFVANDLVRTILNPTLNQAIVLAFIVGIRTVVGWSLSRELKEFAPKEA